MFYSTKKKKKRTVTRPCFPDGNTCPTMLENSVSNQMSVPPPLSLLVLFFFFKYLQQSKQQNLESPILNHSGLSEYHEDPTPGAEGQRSSPGRGAQNTCRAGRRQLSPGPRVEGAASGKCEKARLGPYPSRYTPAVCSHPPCPPAVGPAAPRQRPIAPVGKGGWSLCRHRSRPSGC